MCSIQRGFAIRERSFQQRRVAGIADLVWKTSGTDCRRLTASLPAESSQKLLIRKHREMASLRFDSGPRTGETVPLDKDKVTFGRAISCDCVLSHPTVS